MCAEKPDHQPAHSKSSNTFWQLVDASQLWDLVLVKIDHTLQIQDLSADMLLVNREQGQSFLPTQHFPVQYRDCNGISCPL